MTAARRPLADLHPFVRVKARRFIALAHERGIDVLVFSGHRTREEQARRYALGRTVAGPLGNVDRPLGCTVTNDEPGRSLHELGLAFDACPLMAGMPLGFGRSTTEWRLWQELGDVAQDPRVNLQWGFHADENPPRLKRAWHFFYTAGYSIEELFAGARLPDIPK